MKDGKIDWSSIFDRIWCISYTGYPQRGAPLEHELARVGILGSANFNWHYTFPTIFNNILYDVTRKQLGRNDVKTAGMNSCSMAHYHCIKASYELGDDFVLIMEDDIRFLKDLSKIDEILSDIPRNSDIVLFDILANCCDGATESRKHYEQCLSDKVNEHFCRYDRMWSCGCYALSRKAMRHIISLYESKILPSDHYTSYLTEGLSLLKCFSKTPLTIQIAYVKSNNSEGYGKNAVHCAYEISKPNFSDYNIEIPNYAIGTLVENEEYPMLSVIIPMHNASVTIERCLESIFNEDDCSFFEVLCIDDASTDGTSEIVRNYAALKGIENIRVYEQSNERAGLTRNYGVKKSRGKYLMFIDADDFVERGSIKKAVDEIESLGVDFIRFKTKTIDAEEKNEKIFSLETIPSIAFNKVINTDASSMMISLPPTVTGCIYNREFIRENRIYASDSKCGNDIRFYLSVRIKSSKFAISSTHLYNYDRTVKNSISLNRINNLDIELVNLKDCLDYIVGDVKNDYARRYILNWFTADAKWHFSFCRKINETEHIVDESDIVAAESRFDDYVASSLNNL